jgi:hypothetical protein
VLGCANPLRSDLDRLRQYRCSMTGYPYSDSGDTARLPLPSPLLLLEDRLLASGPLRGTMTAFPFKINKLGTLPACLSG